ncbi:MAG TPA: bifunctional tetrahydrofolate synthase/dihydrofolate synthase [Verrucomicrobiae bacterium]|nr:bifunctional tetrahydrofolate synthase/dihydrofolate synthase [Verrucomicrobiae bacterium]
MANSAPGPEGSLADWLRWQEALHPQGIVLGLERVREVAGRLGLPAQGPRTLTVAGTNGKGSSTALLSEIYRAAGYRVGTYSSPHLLRYNERVAVDGQALGDSGLLRGFKAVEAARGTVALTYFEYGTLAALWLFRELQVQVQVLEVGLGGRLDAVNLVDADGALITNIGLDHVEFLGHDRESIAREKAGVLRRGQVAVCVDPQPPAMLESEAARIGASLWHLGHEYSWQRAGDAWNWHGPERHYKKLPWPALAGAIQLRNAAGVVALITRLQDRLPVAETAIRSGLVRVRLPGRFERRGAVILDVAHNVEAAGVLAENLVEAGVRGYQLVVGMLADKPVEGFLQALAPRAREVHAASLPPPRGLAGEALERRVRSVVATARIWPTVPEAFAAAQAAQTEGGVIVVCGSFLTVAAVAELRHG